MELVKHVLREVVRVISSVTKEHPRVPWVIVRGTLEYAMFEDIRISTVEIFQLPIIQVVVQVGVQCGRWPTRPQGNMLKQHEVLQNSCFDSTKIVT